MKKLFLLIITFLVTISFFACGIKESNSNNETDNNSITTSENDATETEGNEVFFTGECGDNVQWTMYKDGKLVISGTGVIDYNKRTWLTFKDLITKVTINEGITEIPMAGFYACSNIISVYLANSVTQIGNNAFKGCSSINRILIPNSIIKIGSGAFDGCDNLEYKEYSNCCYLGNETYPFVILVKAKNTEIASAEIADTTKIIYDNAFSNCNNLTSISIPQSVMEINNNAFGGCTGLTKVDYKGDISSWCGISFMYDANPLFYAHSLYFNNVLASNIIIPNTIIQIKPYTFDGWNGSDIVLPNSIASIGCCSFRNCNKLTKILIPDSVTDIDAYAFEYCTSLKGITIPDSVTRLGHSSFFACNNLTTVTLSSNLTRIEQYTFAHCKNLEKISLLDNITYIDSYAFFCCSNLTSITIPNKTSIINKEAFANCYKLVEVYNNSSLNLLKGSEEYGKVCYYAKAIYTEPYESKLKVNEDGYILYNDNNEISLIGYIGTNKYLTLPNEITNINQYAFYQDKSIISVIIPDNVKEIGDYAFSNCICLTSVSIGKSMTRIAGRAFNFCPRLVEVYNKSTLNIERGNSNNGYIAYDAKMVYTEPYNSNLLFTQDEYIIYNNGDEKILLGYLGTNTNLILPEEITKINQYAFYQETTLTSIIIPDTMTHIEKYSFQNCYNLTLIIFTGTKAQWNLIIKDYYWNDETGSYTIHCTDGDISK